MGIFDFLNNNDLKQELEAIKSAYNEKVHEMEQQKIEYEKRISELNKDKEFEELLNENFFIEPMRAENNSLKEQINALEEELKNFRSLNDETEQEKNILQNQILTLQDQFDLLNESYNSVISEKSDLDKRIKHQDRWMQNKIKDVMRLESMNNRLQSELEASNDRNLLLSSNLANLKNIYAPFAPFREDVSLLQKAIGELHRQSLRMKFYHLLRCYCLEKILEQKKAYCRQQYNAAVADCRQKIRAYEAEFRIEEYKQLRSYISESEFYRLSPIDRRQLALTRYGKAPKTEYEVGLKYERYIGYLLEMENYEVRYHGALNKFKDKGIDLYALKKKEVLVIQCKRWKKDSVINEGTIRNLSGSVDFAKTKFPKREVIGVLYTTTKATKEAHQMAKVLNIIIYENFDIQEYPLIKCHISKAGEKIYHLPFDQQYDKTFIKPQKGHFYASTVQEAESFGFRRAHKWKPEKQ